MTVHSNAVADAVPGLQRLPELTRYVNSLPVEPRSEALGRLAALSGDDLASLGVSEPLSTEHDYQVTDVQGRIPPDLNGVLYRNGPGRWEDHSGRPLHHLFDGDGMVSAFTIADGTVHYRNRYVRTRHFRGRGGTRHMGTAAVGGWRSNIGRLFPNLANTNVVEHAGRLFALWEGGPPHELDPDTLETMGVRRFGGQLRWMGAYSAHPCFCPRSGEMVNFGVEIVPTPHLRIYRTGRDGLLRHLRSVALPYVAMVHDFAMTERYLVFLVSPIVPDVLPVALGVKPLGDALRYRPERGSTFLLVPRDGQRARRIDIDPVLQFHLSNAYDDGGDVVVDVVTYRDGRLLRAISRFHTSSLDDAPSVFTRFRVTRSGRVLREPLHHLPCEFPRHHPDYAGREHRFAYLNTRRHLAAFYDSVTKINLCDGSESSYVATGPGNSFCEPVFVPRPQAGAEDDGWLLTVEYLADEQKSRLVILDAADPSRGPVAAARLIHQVPQGFHGNFVPRPQ